MRRRDRHQRSKVAPFVVAAVALAVVVGIALAFWAIASAPVHVTVDGQARTVPAGSTVGYLLGNGLLQAKPGALKSVKGVVLKPGGGAPPAVTRDGRPVQLTDRLRNGDVIASSAGADKTEALVTARVTVPPADKSTGFGSVRTVVQTGHAGVREVTRGEVSGVVISSKIVTPAKDSVVVLSRPSSGAKVVALTFDDGPWPGQTDKILDILAKENVKATFFMVGGRVKLAPKLAARVVADGHLIGNHTLGHKDLTKVPPAEVQRQIHGAAAAIENATGKPTVWLRPPYGAINAEVRKTTDALGLKIVMWDVDSGDWTQPAPASIVGTIMKYVRPGSIVLMHDGGGPRAKTIAALPTVIEDLKAQGYTFVTVDQLAK